MKPYSWHDVTRPSPCLKCERREPGCHSRCGDYIAYRRRLDAVIAARVAERAGDLPFDPDKKRGQP